MSETKVFEEIQSEVFDQLELLGERISIKLRDTTKDVLRANKKIDTAGLEKSIDYEMTRIQTQIVSEIFAGVNYDKYVHEGTGPAAGHAKYYPNLMYIRDWVRRKGIATAFVRTKHLSNSFNRKMRAIKSYRNMDDYWTVDKIARAIAWKIYQKGIQGLKFFNLAIKQSESKINQMCAEFKV